jgi:hypothetical protein
MNVRNSEGVISAWESGITALYAWAIPVAQELQSIAELNLRTIGSLNDEMLKGMNQVGNVGNPAGLPAVPCNGADGLVRLLADYSSELGHIVSRLNSELQDVARAQAEKNNILARSLMDTFQGRTSAAVASLNSAVGTVFAVVPNPETVAREETQQVIAAARADRADRARKAAVD